MTDLPHDAEVLDRDGALAEARSGLSRAGFLAAAGAAGAGALLLPGPRAEAQRGRRNDVAIVNYALSLEYLQASFYTETQRGGALEGKARVAAERVGAVERAHVQAFRKLLGAAAIKRPRFDFQGVTEDPEKFLRTAVAFEDLAVAAYKGAAIGLRSRRILAAALGIHTVEARHAAWMRFLNGNPPAANAFDDGRSRSSVLRTVRRTGFIAPAPRMTSRKRPRYTG